MTSDEVEKAASWLEARSRKAEHVAIAGAFRNIAALILRLDKELDEARNKALDEAAAVARRYGATPAPGRDGGTMILQSVNGHDVANAILALKSPAKEPTT